MSKRGLTNEEKEARERKRAEEARELAMCKQTREEIHSTVEGIEQDLAASSTTYETDPAMYYAVQEILTLLKRNL